MTTCSSLSGRAKIFESMDREFLTEKTGLTFSNMMIKFSSDPEHGHSFDIVFSYWKVVGDAKFLSNIQTPAAKCDGITA